MASHDTNAAALAGLTNGSSAPNTYSTIEELVEYTQALLDAEDEEHAQAAGQANGQVSHDLAPGATIDLSKKGMHHLPVEVIEIMKERVERLALSHNPQVIIPSQIVKCDRLRYLNVRANQLTEFPEAILALSKLEILDLSKNEITSIPEDIKRMTSLRFLAVVRNKISRLPLAFGEMPNLHKLKFEENPILFPTAEDLRMNDDGGKSGHKDMDKDREVCVQVKRVMKNAMKSKALRQRLLKSSSEEDTSESNTETPRPQRRQATGRFPVRPSISGIDGLGDLIRSASSSPPEPPVLPLPRSLANSPSRPTYTTRPAAGPLVNGIDDSRSRSESMSTTASFKTRRQGLLPHKRNNEPPQSTEGVHQPIRASNASTIKPGHAYKASTSSVLSAVSSGAESTTTPSPSNMLNTHLRRTTSTARHGPNRSQSTPALAAARRLQRSLYTLSQPLLHVADNLIQRLQDRSQFQQHVISANSLTGDLEHLLGMLAAPNLDLRSQHMISHKLNIVLRAALNTYSALVGTVKTFASSTDAFVDSYSARNLMFQLYSLTVEMRNIAQLLKVPAKAAIKDVGDTPRASTVSQAWSSRTATPTDARSNIAMKRMRGATIIRNQASNASLRVVPPSRVTGSSRLNTETSFMSSTSPLSATSITGTQRRIPRSVIGSSSDEHDENTEHFERIFLKLRDACDVANYALVQCESEIKAQHGNALREGQLHQAPLWQMASKTCRKVTEMRKQLEDGLNNSHPSDPNVRSTKEFWQLCDNFVQSWTDFATAIKDIGLARVDISTMRNIMKPVQRAVKDVSKTISDSSLYHQALRGTNHAARTLAPPFPSALNTAIAPVISQSSPNPASAVPSSAHSAATISMPATPLTAALGPAALATMGSMSNAGSMVEYFPTGVTAANMGPRPGYERLDTSFASSGSTSAPQSATAGLSAGGAGHSQAFNYARR